MIRDVIVTGNTSTSGLVLILPDGTRIAAQPTVDMGPLLKAGIEAESRRWVRGTVFCEFYSGGYGRVRVKAGDRFRYWPFPDDQDMSGIDLEVKSVTPEGEITLTPIDERSVATLDRAFPQTEFVRGEVREFRRVGNDMLVHEAWSIWMSMEYHAPTEGT